jgi:CDP-6-deoxy-D-xylo-4-hexulose-3-dehydrase
MVCTNDEDFYHLLLSIRSHGWDRDLPELKKQELREKYDINNFRALYTFYYPGFNLRSTDLQAFLGIDQMNSINNIVVKRKNNFDLYNKLIKNDIWKISPPENSYVSNFAYPIITEKIDALVEELQKNNVECRPLICGSMSEQPFWYENYEKILLPNATKVHNLGLYLPNHHELSENEIIFISDIVNKIL